MERLHPAKNTNSSIGSIENLAQALSIEKSKIIKAVNMPARDRYDSKSIPKNSGGHRIVYNPAPLIRLIQSRINERIFKKLISWPDFLFGSIPNVVGTTDDESIKRDYIACAEKHCEAKSLIKFDISNFFENIHKDLVFDIFKNFLRYPQDVSETLTNLCCHEDSIVQGALTSSYIASLCLWNLEGNLVQRLKKRNLTYTRLVDDITISSKTRNYNYEHAEAYLKEVMLKKDLPLNSSKKLIMRAGSEPLMVHGLRVDFSTPRLPSNEVAKIRAAVHNTIKMASNNNYRTSNSYRKQYDRCIGRVNKLARVKHNKHKTLLNKLLQKRPLPSEKDIEKAKKAISRLKKHPIQNRASHQYKRLYGLTMYRIGIIGRTYKKEQTTLIHELRNLKP